MKRRTRLIYIGFATLGGLFISSAATQAAFAAPTTSQTVEQITVLPGDTLSGIGARTNRSWETLASYNQLANPNLVLVGQVINIPAAGYVPPASPSAATYKAPDGDGDSDDVASSSTAPIAHVATVAPTAHVVSTPAPVVHVTAATTSSAAPSGVWGCIAQHESGGNPSTNTGNGYYGMYQDTQSTWVAAGGLAYAPRADLASAADQLIVNEKVQAMQGWGAWPLSSVACGV